MAEPQDALNANTGNVTEQPNGFEIPKDPRRLTNIDWSKDTPKTAKEWKALSPIEKLDWSIWHERQVQHNFAVAAIVLEIIAAIIAIILMDCGIGLSVLIGFATLIVAIVTGVFSYFLYRALRALFAGSLVGLFFAVIADAIFQEEPLHTVSIVSSYVVSIALLGLIEAQGGIGKKIPDFPGPKEPSLIEEIKKLNKELKKATANWSKKSKSKNGGSWFQNTLQAWSDAGMLDNPLYDYNIKKK